MVVINKAEQIPALDVRGMIGTPGLYGDRFYGFGFYGFGDLLWGIYQKRRYNGKRVLVRERFYYPTYSNTPPLAYNRRHWRWAMTAWRDLTAPQKANYNGRGERRHMSGLNLFFRLYMTSIFPDYGNRFYGIYEYGTLVVLRD